MAMQKVGEKVVKAKKKKRKKKAKIHNKSIKAKKRKRKKLKKSNKKKQKKITNLKNEVAALETKKQDKDTRDERQAARYNLSLFVVSCPRDKRWTRDEVQRQRRCGHRYRNTSMIQAVRHNQMNSVHQNKTVNVSSFLSSLVD